MRQRGFTLIELLVVIAVVAVLIGILIPSLNLVRQRAGSAVCSSNNRSVIFNLNLYHQDNGIFPHCFDDRNFGSDVPLDGYIGDASYDRLGLWWFDHLKDYEVEREEGSILWCPSRNYAGKSIFELVLLGNYGVNRSILKDAVGVDSVDEEFIGRPLKMENIKSPFNTLLLVDSGYAIASWKAVEMPYEHFDHYLRDDFFYIPGIETNDQRDISDRAERDALRGRHGDCVNVGFVDEHVERTKVDKLAEKSAGRYQIWSAD